MMKLICNLSMFSITMYAVKQSVIGFRRNDKNLTCIIGTSDSEINDFIPADNVIKSLKSLFMHSSQRIVFLIHLAMFFPEINGSTSNETGKGSFGPFESKKASS